MHWMKSGERGVHSSAETKFGALTAGNCFFIGVRPMSWDNHRLAEWTTL